MTEQRKNESRGSKVEVLCACGCGKKFMARVADRKRGWGRFFSKSCKAKYQERHTGQYRDFLRNSREERDIEDTFHPHDPYSLGQ